LRTTDKVRVGRGSYRLDLLADGGLQKSSPVFLAWRVNHYSALRTKDHCTSGSKGKRKITKRFWANYRKTTTAD